MNSSELISLYNLIFYICLAIALLGLLLAVFLFFHYDIPSIYKRRPKKGWDADMNNTPGKKGKNKNRQAAPAKQNRKQMGPKPETDSDNAVETVQLKKNSQSIYPDNEEDETAITEQLLSRTPGTDPHSAKADKSDSLPNETPNFQITEETIIIHSDEII